MHCSKFLVPGPREKQAAGLGGRKAPSSMGKLGTDEVLRLRATSAMSRDKSVRRSAQDDDFVGVLTKHILDNLALTGTVAWATLSRPLRQAQGRLYGTQFGESSSHADYEARTEKMCFPTTNASHYWAKRRKKLVAFHCGR
jgi:hypothetical protein